MNKTAIFLCGLLLPAAALGAQSPQHSDSSASYTAKIPDQFKPTRSSTAGEQSESSTGWLSSHPLDELPDSPTPKISADDNYNRGTWRGGDPGPLNFNKPEPSIGRAMRNPGVLTYSALLAVLTAIQLHKTDQCIDTNKPTCNLLFGKNRTATYAFNIPLTAGIILATARLKERGNGVGMFLVMMAGLMYEAPLAYTANPHVLVCRSGRTPQCQ
jgi:hypothetical protein